MKRFAHILIPAAALVVLVAGSALANGGFTADQQRASARERHSTDREGGPPSQKQLDKIVARLGEAGIESDADAVADLAADYGVGGAVRVLAWANASGKNPSEIAAMRDSGMGWGEIARQLNEEDPEGDLELGSGIGSIMGGHGQGHGDGHGNGPGRAKKQK